MIKGLQFLLYLFPVIRRFPLSLIRSSPFFSFVLSVDQQMGLAHLCHNSQEVGSNRASKIDHVPLPGEEMRELAALTLGAQKPWRRKWRRWVLPPGVLPMSLSPPLLPPCRPTRGKPIRNGCSSDRSGCGVRTETSLSIWDSGTAGLAAPRSSRRH